MRIDHVSYATSHDTVVDVVQRIGSQLGASFIDGGIHPQFGTRNFILPLKESRYIEVVCPLDHPAADKTPFGQLVIKKAESGGGWLSWVIAVEDLSPIEGKLNRKAIEAHRKKPDGQELLWRQIGVLDTLSQASSPYFIQWKSENHPSSERDSNISLKLIELFGQSPSQEDAYDIRNIQTRKEVQVKWLEGEEENGIRSVTFLTSSGNVTID